LEGLVLGGQVGSEEVEDARSEMPSMLGSVPEDVVIGIAEAADLRSRRVPEESRENVKDSIAELERVRDGGGDEDRELVCFHGYSTK
jgi:hypothetical protein